MKTRKMWLRLFVLATLLAPQFLRAQNVGININANQLSILNGNQGTLDVYMCNNDPGGLSTPPNAVAALVSFPINLTILGVTKLDGTALAAADFDIIFISNNDSEGSHDVKVRYKKPLVAFDDCAEFRVLVQGNAVGNGLILGTLQFEQLLASNDTDDDNSESSIPVMVNLPVTLRDFNAEKVEGSAKLTWHTTEETNSDRFEVQRSVKGKEWTTIESVQSAGESTITRSYEAIDRTPLKGENLYRLKMVDNDSSTAFSRVRSVKFDGTLAFVYPNPVGDYLHLNDDNWANVSQVTILDKNGRQVYVSGKNPESKIDVRSLASGIYNVRIKNADGLENSYRIAVAK
ncbi:T9SS type A sorting domain-containing protein [Dyadobacter sp. CY261]|uniref:T9SS type A sorting domain-containing protein n=1 Tax=Dyadobacter sp. CY261 TaxID=2907203 RepID=UPI001F44CE1C|nr:T9SS type A sorting domain-containing protein [Dyadobacter sp. CY261]MCF0070731.1 T9SS type A sorting domain-containing protein [Dyadobacter sp. CY261]